jgi:phospholipid/cholesterol/gamma-HCH transport system permease protein
MIQCLSSLGNYVHFAVRATVGLVRVVLRPRDLSVQAYTILLGALPLALIAGIALGLVVWMHLRGALQEVGGPGALKYLPQGLALAVVLEFAPIGAGLIMAGRSGASLGAELGSMKLTEQIDALEAFGIGPIYKLVAPRIAACMFALPMLTVFIVYLALASAFLAESIGGNMSATQFVNECLRVLTLRRVIPALVRTVVFGYLVGITACYFGLHAHGGTEGVGHAATRGVVASTMLVLAANVFLVRLIQISI